MCLADALLMTQSWSREEQEEQQQQPGEGGEEEEDYPLGLTPSGSLCAGSYSYFFKRAGTAGAAGTAVTAGTADCGGGTAAAGGTAGVATTTDDTCDDTCSSAIDSAVDWNPLDPVSGLELGVWDVRVIFSPSVIADVCAAEATVTLTVVPHQVVLDWLPLPSIAYGQPLSTTDHFTGTYLLTLYTGCDSVIYDPSADADPSISLHLTPLFLFFLFFFFLFSFCFSFCFCFVHSECGEPVGRAYPVLLWHLHVQSHRWTVAPGRHAPHHRHIYTRLPRI